MKYDLAHDRPSPQPAGWEVGFDSASLRRVGPALYHNEGNGRFRDVSGPAGITAAIGKALGVAVCDVNRDGWPDLYVANDTTPNSLFRNSGRGRFAEVATEAGVAYGEDALARGGMGVDAATIGRQGQLALFVANFSNEPCSFFWEVGSEFSPSRRLPWGWRARRC